MNFVDVNVLIYAHRKEMDRSDDFAAWIDAARSSSEVLAVPSAVISGFLRIVTNPKAFDHPTMLKDAWAFCEEVTAGPSNIVVEPGPRHLSIFRDLCMDAKATGKLIPDVYLAAMAIEVGATFYSTDGDFGRFRGLDWRRPLDPPANGR